MTVGRHGEADGPIGRLAGGGEKLTGEVGSEAGVDEQRGVIAHEKSAVRCPFIWSDPRPRAIGQLNQACCGAGKSS